MSQNPQSSSFTQTQKETAHVWKKESLTMSSKHQQQNMRKWKEFDDQFRCQFRMTFPLWRFMYPSVSQDRPESEYCCRARLRRRRTFKVMKKNSSKIIINTYFYYPQLESVYNTTTSTRIFVCALFEARNIVPQPLVICRAEKWNEQEEEKEENVNGGRRGEKVYLYWH